MDAVAVEVLVEPDGVHSVLGAGEPNGVSLETDRATESEFAVVLDRDARDCRRRRSAAILTVAVLAQSAFAGERAGPKIAAVAAGTKNFLKGIGTE
jgi:hypothetical protein